ncbi:MAG: hypothetical protein E7568_03740 [Ruminococcaceae bacterium]|nr:hypothetical protein [Oscillospiraceae bacterium]
MKKRNSHTEFSSLPVYDQPENVTELVNKYGTYEIQPTCNTLNKYPTIAQGYSKKDKNARENFKK